jgi:hypothetical protein
MQSHLVRRPLANILGATEMLLNDTISQEDSQLLLSALRKEANDLDYVIKEISRKTIL